MKATLLFISVMALCLLIIPMIAMSYDIGRVTAAEPVSAQIHSPSVPEAVTREDSYPAVDEAAGEETEPLYGDEYVGEEALDDVIEASSAEPVLTFNVLDQTTGRINEISLRDFVRGAVAAEMPVSFHSEALKAQAVAAHTFALHGRLAQQKSPDAGLMGADFGADPSNMKVYITEAKAKEFYGGGELADIYWNKICDAADSVMNYILEYDDEPIVAAYHAISSGQTEDAANVWSGSAPYLVPVKSEGDFLAPGFETTVTMTQDEVKSKLLARYPDLNFGGEPSLWFGEATRTDSGYVYEIEVGGAGIAGKELRQVFGLRSHDFDVSYADGEFTFTVRGYGHGVGLSQYGADFLARQGYTFDEILSAYYTGAVLKTILEQ